MDIFKTIILRSYFNTFMFQKMTQLMFFVRPDDTEGPLPATLMENNTEKIYASPRTTNIDIDTNINTEEEVAKTFIRFFYFNPHQKISVSNKYMCIHNVINNPFVSSEIQNYYIQHLSMVQRKYFVLLRFVQNCKRKRAKIQVSSDLYMNELDANHRRTFSLFQLGRIYLFSISDLVKIILGSICHSSFLFPLPIRTKNPYTHQEFSKSDLYNIYFKLKDTLLCIPHLLELYFRCDFDIYRFKKQHSTDIFQTIVRNYIDNLQPNDFLRVFDEMLSHLRMSDIIEISSDYPTDRLIPVMKPFLYMYAFSKYTCDRQLENNVSYELCHRLRAFVRHNPLFGRKIYKSAQKYSVAKETFTFVHAKPQFVFSSSETFLRSHLYSENTYNSYIFHGRMDIGGRTSYTTDVDTDTDTDNGYQPVFSFRSDGSSLQNRRIRQRATRFVSSLSDESSEDIQTITPSTPPIEHYPNAVFSDNGENGSLPPLFFDDTDESDEDDANRGVSAEQDSSSDEETVRETHPMDIETDSDPEEELEEEDYDW